MAGMEPIRLAKAAKTYNVGKDTIVEHLKDKGFDVDDKPTFKLTGEMHEILAKEFQSEINAKEEAAQITLGIRNRENIEIEKPQETKQEETPPAEPEEKILIKDNTLQPPVEEVKEEPAAAEPKAEEPKKEEEKPAEKGEEDDVIRAEAAQLDGPKIAGKIDLDSIGKKGKSKSTAKKKEAEAKPKSEEKKPAEKAPKKEEAKPKKEPVGEKAEEPKKEASKKETAKSEEEADKVIRVKTEKLEGPKVLGRIELPVNKPKRKDDKKDDDKPKRKRKRIASPRSGDSRGGNNRGNQRSGRRDNQKRGKGKEAEPQQVSEKEIEEKIKATMAKMSGGGGKKVRQKIRRQKRSEMDEKRQLQEGEVDDKVLEVTEFVTVSELASMMDVGVTQVISTCMSLGVIVSINQRLDAEIIELVANEFEYETNFVDASTTDTSMDDEEDDPEDLVRRAPIVTIMGHVDHGKTSLLDYIRRANVADKEAGGITQHIGAYDVKTKSGKQVTFLDTPGHEAFTAMRARGAKVTDIVIIVVAADDGVMPQTKEAISHAQSAGVPMIFAINKIDKEGANPNRVMEELSQQNILLEAWGGDHQSQEVSAKTGQGVDDLLEQVLLQAEILDLKANPETLASGSMVEASLDKGRGYVGTVLVQRGNLTVGDIIVAGPYHGKVKAMFDHRGKKVKKAGPSVPVQILGLDGAPSAGEKFKVFATEQEARGVANRRSQLQREQGLRTQKHITLDEIGRRLALGTFKELNIIIKGDVDGSIEALSDSLLKLSTEEIQINILHKAVGQISESDVLLASASDAIIIGFQVRPSAQARRLAETEDIEVRLYSVIYNAIEEVKDAMEGMLEPDFEENIIANVEIRETFKISKVGTIAGCYVLDGKIHRNAKVRIIRDGIVQYEGELASLKRFKDDVKEVKAGMECGLNIEKYNDIKVGDIVEAYEMVEVKRKLSDVKKKGE